MKKKILSLLVVFLFVFGFVACEKTTTKTTEQTSQTESTITTVGDLAPVLSGVEDRSVVQDSEVDVLEGITASDDIDGDLTESITYESDFDVTTVGEYTVTVSVTDSKENTSTDSFVITVTERELTDEEKVTLDLQSISISYPDLKLPKWGSNGSVFFWGSSDPKVVTNEGYVINPTVGSDPAVVTLTVTASKGGYQATKDFQVTILPNPEVEVTSHVTLPFEGTSEEYVVASQDEVDVFYVDGGSVPYIDVQTYLNMIDGAIESEMLQYSYPDSDLLRIEYTYTYTDIDGVTEITDTYWAQINFTENTFTVSNFDFFAGYQGSTEGTDFSDGLNYVDQDYVEGQEVVIPLGDYNMDLVIYEEEGVTYYLMPLHVTNRLFAGDVYYDVYYNGDKLWGLDTFVVSGMDDAGEALVKSVISSSLNAEDAPFDMRLATYHYLAFVMDYFYGLKPDKGYDTFYDRIYASAKTIIEGTDNRRYTQIFTMAYGMDDLHTSYAFDGYWNNPVIPTTYIDDLGPSGQAFYDYLANIRTSLTTKFETDQAGDINIPKFTLLDNDTIAVIHITGFVKDDIADVDTARDFKEALDSLPATVEDVIIDLSYNTGGNIGTVMRMFGYMTEEQYMYHSQNPADGSTVTYYIESDYVAYDYNWYVLTSGVTFSAANMFASMAKELGIPILGQQSSGGACSIGLVINPDGSAIMISTNNVLSTRSGDEVNGYTYTSVESGVPVDYQMSDVTSNNELINIITQIRTQVTE